ncbi:Gp48 [Mycolicibacterium thermoresistibile]|uniref:Gp48 n=1 Tax=Mycolicibacterium thermoresistibile TaxID=1797 RepID=A0A100XAS5_MYCTH|nr:Gp48 [Mycolicibacterium thermoresistibile]
MWLAPENPATPPELPAPTEGETVTDCPTPDKRAFRSAAAARRFWRRSYIRTGKHRLHPYRCPGCDHWHLTHQTPAEQRAIAARIARKARTP